MHSWLTKKVAIIALAVSAFLLIAGLTEYTLSLYRKDDKTQLIAKITTEAGIIRTQIEYEINSTLNLILGLTVYVAANPELDGEEFAFIAHNLLSRTEFIRNIGLARNNVITFVYPLEGNEEALGVRYADLEDQWPAVKEAIEKRQIIVAGPLNLVQGEAFISRIPIFLDDTSQSYWGIASIVMAVEGFYSHAGLDLAGEKMNLALRGRDGKGAEGEVFFGDPSLFKEDAVIMPIKLPHGSWELAAAPVMGWKTPLLPQFFIRFFGYILAAITATLVLMMLKAYQQVHFFALHDSLTGLGNRRLLDVLLHQNMALANRQQKKIAILYIDLDHFKPINDRYGHRKGDLALMAVGSILKKAVRESDIVSRLGGMNLSWP